jgi:hypothetical protein
LASTPVGSVLHLLSGLLHRLAGGIGGFVGRPLGSVADLFGHRAGFIDGLFGGVRSGGSGLFDVIHHRIAGHFRFLPRVVAVLAGGTFAGEASGPHIALVVRAAKGDPDWGIIESPFMRDRASTRTFEHRVEIDGDRMRYTEFTGLEIYGRSFEHTDENELTRSEE